MRCIQQLVRPPGNIFIRLTVIQLLIWLILFSKSNVHFTWMASRSASKFNGFLPDPYCILSLSFVEIGPAGFSLISLTNRRKHNLSIPNANTPRMSNHRMRRSEIIWKGLKLREIPPDVMCTGWVGSCLSMRSQLKEGRRNGFASGQTTLKHSRQHVSLEITTLTARLPSQEGRCGELRSRCSHVTQRVGLPRPPSGPRPVIVNAVNNMKQA